MQGRFVLNRWKFPVLVLITILAGGASLPEEGPLPKLLEERKAQPERTEPLTGTGADPKKEAASPGVKPEVTPKEKLVVAAEDPAKHTQCVEDLKAMDAVFEEAARIDDGDGCGIDKPLVVKSIAGVLLKPEATMRCPAALALAKWIDGSVKPTAGTALGKDKQLTAIDQASSYVCRLRNSAETGKISEHARGNALDIAALHFGDDVAVNMTPRQEDGTMTGAFQRAITASACLYFATVLSPGSDAAHETHLHLDALERDSDFRYCR